jgi:3-isopropylmalate/(R)-2-methylmalate dehydratase small subunit
MEKFKKVTSRPAPLNSANVDTDQIIPKQFLKRIERTGFGQFLFFDWRFNDDGSENQKFILNKANFKKSEILLARDNFGCGSSREHAPWALRDYGFKVIISSSFADILYNNCFKNCILPIVLDEEKLEYLFESTIKYDDYELVVNLNDESIVDNKNFNYNFNIDPFRKKFLLEGLDDIALTLEHEEKIIAYENANN